MIIIHQQLISGNVCPPFRFSRQHVCSLFAVPNPKCYGAYSGVLTRIFILTKWKFLWHRLIPPPEKIFCHIVCEKKFVNVKLCIAMLMYVKYKKRKKNPCSPQKKTTTPNKNNTKKQQQQPPPQKKKKNVYKNTTYTCNHQSIALTWPTWLTENKPIIYLSMQPNKKESKNKNKETLWQR